MNIIKYHLEIGPMTSCMKIIMEEINSLGQRDVKGATKACFLFESWFASKRSEEAAMYVGSDIIGMVKTNIEVLCKDYIKNLTKYLQVGYYLMIKRNYVVPGYRTIIDIGYKYNVRKVLHFIATK